MAELKRKIIILTLLFVSIKESLSAVRDTSRRRRTTSGSLENNDNNFLRLGQHHDDLDRRRRGQEYVRKTKSKKNSLRKSANGASKSQKKSKTQKKKRKPATIVFDQEDIDSISTNLLPQVPQNLSPVSTSNPTSTIQMIQILDGDGIPTSSPTSSIRIFFDPGADETLSSSVNELSSDPTIQVSISPTGTQLFTGLQRLSPSMPSGFPTARLSSIPSVDPSSMPSTKPSGMPSALLSTSRPSDSPSARPSNMPSIVLSTAPSLNPSNVRSNIPTEDITSLGLCQGNCNSDLDCQYGLICFQRELSTTAVPGCTGSNNIFDHTNYCIKAAEEQLVINANKGHLKSNYPLGICEGNCVSDSDCQVRGFQTSYFYNKSTKDF